MSQIDLLVTVRRDAAGRYYKNLAAFAEFNLTLATDVNEAFEVLESRENHVDVLVLDSHLDQAHQMILELRYTYPRLLIVVVDEEADFAIPGQADDVSTAPFTNDDLVRRIKRLMSERRLETLRADTIPHVREFAKALRRAVGEMGKQQAAVSACRDLDYDYVAFYRVDTAEPLMLSLRAQEGPPQLQAIAPQQATAEDIVGWVAQTGQSRVASPQDDVSYALVAQGHLGSVACTAVGKPNAYGVIVAGRSQPGSITQQQVMLLELVSAQLAAVVTQE